MQNKNNPQKLFSELNLYNIKIGNPEEERVNVIFLNETTNINNINITNFKYIFCCKHSQEIAIRKKGFYRTSLYDIENINNIRTRKILECLEKGKFPLKVKITGHLRGIYSLAIANRDFIFSLEKNTSLDISVDWNESNPKFEYNLNYLKDYPRIIELIEKSKYSKLTDVEIRGAWPVLTNPSSSKVLINYLAWEESKIPPDLVKLYSIYDEFFTISNFVKVALKNSGIYSPVLNVGHGIDYVEKTPLIEIKAKSEKLTFLHISSGLPRKGVNDLIDAFMEAFKEVNDVQLIIKTYYNPYNTVEEHLKQYSNQNKIIHICKDYSNEEIENLYSKSDVYISPSRGEGFNRPVAEAMIRNIPVLVTGWGGHMDFCNDSNSYLIKYNLAQSNLQTSHNDSSWAIIDTNDLIEKLKNVRREIKSNSKRLVNQINSARENCIIKNDWAKVSEESEIYLNNITSKYLKLGVLSTWRTKCGIANYTESLVNSLNDPYVKIIILGNVNSEVFGKDKSNVVRCWDERNIIEKQHEETYKKIIENGVEHLLVEYHTGQHNLFSLLELFIKLGDSSIKTTIDIHSTLDFYYLITSSNKYLKLLKKADKYIKTYIVHNESNIKEISEIVSLDKIKVITHGNRTQIELSTKDKEILKSSIGLNGKKIIATHGFMLPHKGHDLIANSLVYLKNKEDYIFLNVSSTSDLNSQSVIAKENVKKIIEVNLLENNYLHIEEFLTQEQIDKLLQIADILIFPYKANNESASGAVRNALLVNSPIIVSNEKIFDDIRKYVITINSIEPQSIAESIEKYILNIDTKLIDDRIKYLKDNSWSEKMKQIIKYIKNV